MMRFFFTLFLIVCFIKVYPRTNASVDKDVNILPETSYQTIASSKKIPAHPVDSIEIMKMYTKKGTGMYNNKQYQEALNYFGKALLIAGRVEHTRLIIENRYCLAITNSCLGNFTNALASFNLIDSILKAHPGYENYYPGYISMGKAYIYKKLNQFDKSLQYYKKANSLLQDGSSRNYLENIANNYISMGNIHKFTYQYKKAISFYQMALDILMKKEALNKASISNIYNNLGNTYISAYGQPYKAIEYYNTSIFYKKQIPNELLGNVYKNLANTHYKTGNYQKASVYFKKAEKDYVQKFGTGYYKLIDLYNNMAANSLDNKDASAAGKYLTKADSLIQELEYQKPDFTSEYYYLKSRYEFALHENYEKALHHAQQSIIPLTISFKATSYHENPAPEQVNEKSRVFAYLKWKAGLLEKYYYQSGALELLKASLETYILASKVLNRVRLGQSLFEDKLRLGNSMAGLFDAMMETAFSLYKLTGDKKYIEQAFIISEQARYFILTAAIHHEEAKKIGNIPDSLLYQETKMENQIARKKELIGQFQRSPGQNIVKQQKLEKELFQLNMKRDELVSLYGQKYPLYHEIKFSMDYPGVYTVQKHLPRNESLLEYYLNDSVLYTFLLSRKHTLFLHQAIDSSFYENVATVREHVQSYHMANHSIKSLGQFAQASHALYNILLKPMKDKLNHDLIIVPHGDLHFIPFETLLQSPENNISYRDLNYLIHDHNPRYAYSAKLLLKSILKEKNAKSEGLIAFGPSYNHDKIMERPSNRATDVIYEKLPPLKGVEQEITAISRYYQSSLYMGNKATETCFKKNAGSSRLIHLAMHSWIDRENPMYSKLLFARDSVPDEDGLLNVHEIYNLSLQASLVTLSACNTGFGKLEKGEGVMNIASGFIQAGCSDIVYTLWPIEDHSTARLMKFFYKKLSGGSRVSQALREAKLDFLEMADPLEAHPYFWAGFLSMGKNNPVQGLNTLNILAYSLPGFLILVFLLFLTKRKLPKGVEGYNRHKSRY